MEENNKLIAEFMGAKFNDEGFAKITKITHNGVEVLKLKEDDFEYDFSWDWLMPVVEKCFSTEEHTEGHHYFINESLLTLKIEIVYDRVVEFIKNQNK